MADSVGVSLGLDASWIPLVALMVGVMTGIALLRVFGAVFCQALAHYELAVSARKLRQWHMARLKEIERAIERENKARAEANEQRSAIMRAMPIDDSQLVGVDILEAA